MLREPKKKAAMVKLQAFHENQAPDTLKASATVYGEGGGGGYCGSASFEFNFPHVPQAQRVVVQRREEEEGEEEEEAAAADGAADGAG